MHRFGARVRKRRCAVCQRSLPDRDASLHRAMLLRLRQSRLSNELDRLRPRKAFREHFYAPPMAARSFAICLILRPVLTDLSSSFLEIGLASAPVFKISHWFFSLSRPRMRTSVHSPLTFLPSRTR